MGDFNDFEDVDDEDEDVLDDEDNYDEGVMLIHRKMGPHFQHINSQTCKCCPHIVKAGDPRSPGEIWKSIRRTDTIH
jgi:hypothetical protein